MTLSDSVEGRWTIPDSMGGDITNPQSLNRYAYVDNNPATLTDPSGLGLWGMVWGMSNIHRLRTTDRIFFVSVNLRRQVEPFGVPEYPLMIDVLEGSRWRLGFLLC